MRLGDPGAQHRDGQWERTNQTVEIDLRCHTYSNPEVDWAKVLPAVQHNINNSFAVTVERPPNELVPGFKSRSIADLLETRQASDQRDVGGLYLAEPQAPVPATRAYKFDPPPCLGESTTWCPWPISGGQHRALTPRGEKRHDWDRSKSPAKMRLMSRGPLKRSPTVKFLIYWKGWEQKHNRWESHREPLADVREPVREYEVNHSMDVEALIEERTRKREEKEARRP